MSAQDRASDLLIHYFSVAFEAAGARWDSDNSSEVEEIVEAIADLVRDEIRTALRETDRRHAGLGLLCDQCDGPCQIDNPAGGETRA